MKAASSSSKAPIEEAAEVSNAFDTSNQSEPTEEAILGLEDEVCQLHAKLYEVRSALNCTSYHNSES